MKKTDYDKAYEWYKHNYNSLPIEERKGLTDLFTRLSEIRSLMIMQCEILTKLQIRHEELTYKAIEWYYENNSDSNEQSVQAPSNQGLNDSNIKNRDEKIKTIPKSKMKGIRERSPSLIDEYVLLIEETINKNKEDYGKETETLHQE